jgi:hypothetical protein
MCEKYNFYQKLCNFLLELCDLLYAMFIRSGIYASIKILSIMLSGKVCMDEFQNPENLGEQVDNTENMLS